MLPGLRFLFITTTLSASVLVFAIGAAALLRATHDNFATFASRRTPQEQVFIKPQFEAATPTIALLRVEPEPERAEDVVSVAASSTDETISTAQANVTALDFPDPPAPAIVDMDVLRREVMQSATDAAVETAPAVSAPIAEAQAVVPEQTASITTPATDKNAKLAADKRKKAEAAKLQASKRAAARRAREARVSAQRRRAAIARAAQRQTQTQSPALFNPGFGTAN